MVHAQYNRTSADYGAVRRFSREEADDARTLADGFVDAVRSVLAGDGVLQERGRSSAVASPEYLSAVEIEKSPVDPSVGRR